MRVLPKEVLGLNHLNLQVKVYWRIDDEKFHDQGRIHMVGPNYLGLAKPYPDSAPGARTEHMISIPIANIVRIFVVETGCGCGICTV